MDSALEPSVFIKCNWCNNYLISEIMKFDAEGNCYHEKCYILYNEQNTTNK